MGTKPLTPDRGALIQRDVLARREPAGAPVRSVTDDRPQAREIWDPLREDLAGGDDIVRARRAGRRGEGQSQDLDQQRVNRTDFSGDSIVWRNMESWQRATPSVYGGTHRS